MSRAALFSVTTLSVLGILLIYFDSPHNGQNDKSVAAQIQVDSKDIVREKSDSNVTSLAKTNSEPYTNSESYNSEVNDKSTIEVKNSNDDTNIVIEEFRVGDNQSNTLLEKKRTENAFDLAFELGVASCMKDRGYKYKICLLYTSPSPRDKRQSRMPSSA